MTFKFSDSTRANISAIIKELGRPVHGRGDSVAGSHVGGSIATAALAAERLGAGSIEAARVTALAVIAEGEATGEFDAQTADELRDILRRIFKQ